MTQNQECAKYLPGNLRKDARRDAVLKMRTDARRNSFSGTRAQLCISHSHKTRFENKDFRLSVCFFGCFQIFFFQAVSMAFSGCQQVFFRILLIFFFFELSSFICQDIGSFLSAVNMFAFQTVVMFF